MWAVRAWVSGRGGNRGVGLRSKSEGRIGQDNLAKLDSLTAAADHASLRRSSSLCLKLPFYLGGGKGSLSRQDSTDSETATVISLATIKALSTTPTELCYCASSLDDLHHHQQQQQHDEQRPSSASSSSVSSSITCGSSLQRDTSSTSVAALSPSVQSDDNLIQHEQEGSTYSEASSTATTVYVVCPNCQKTTNQGDREEEVDSCSTHAAASAAAGSATGAAAGSCSPSAAAAAVGAGVGEVAGGATRPPANGDASPRRPGIEGLKAAQQWLAFETHLHLRRTEKQHRPLNNHPALPKSHPSASGIPSSITSPLSHHRKTSPTPSSSSSSSTTKATIHPQLPTLMRAVIVDWITDIHARLKLAPQSLYLAILILDRFTSEVQLDRPALQLLALASLLIASKHEDISAPSVKTMLRFTESFPGGPARRAQLLTMERRVLEVMGFSFMRPTTVDFLDRYLAVRGASILCVGRARYLAERSLLDPKIVRQWAPSRIASAAIYLARKHEDPDAWPEELEELTGYSEDDIYHVAVALSRCVNEPLPLVGARRLTALTRKYASPRHNEVSNLSYMLLA